uniref:Uncharacterized protein n=1 Tax=Anguilla anguilla TaxID=7936 RepID=A0A0E9WAM5_ANGAN
MIFAGYLVVISAYSTSDLSPEDCRRANPSL